MIFRAALILVALFTLSACNKKKAAAIAAGEVGIEYLFFDDFDRADGDFSSDTTYVKYPSGTGVEVHSNSVRAVADGGFVSLMYNTAVTADSVGVTATLKNVGGTGDPFGMVTMADTPSVLASHIMYCGFNFENTLGIFDDGSSSGVGSETFTFSDGVEVTILLTRDGDDYTCAATDGTTQSTILYTDLTPTTRQYMGLYSGDVGGKITHMDNFGVWDIAANIGRRLLIK